MRRAAAAAVVLAVAAGCGGDDRLSEEELRTRANAICAKYDRRIDALGRPSSVEEVEGFAKRAAELTRKGIAELNALEPPKELEADYERFLAEGEKVVALSERLERAARERDVEELQQILRDAEASDRRSDAVARELGLTECTE